MAHISNLVQQAFVPCIPPYRRVRIPLNQRFRRIAGNEHNVTLKLIGMEADVGILPPWHELATRPLLVLLVIHFLGFSAARRAVGAFQAGWRLDESQPSKETHRDEKVGHLCVAVIHTIRCASILWRWSDIILELVGIDGYAVRIMIPFSSLRRFWHGWEDDRRRDVRI